MDSRWNLPKGCDLVRYFKPMAIRDSTVETYDDLVKLNKSVFLGLNKLVEDEKASFLDEVLQSCAEISFFANYEAFFEATKVRINPILEGLMRYVDSEDDPERQREKHPDLFVPYGPSFIALLQKEETSGSFDFFSHTNPGIRAIFASYATNKDVLEFLSCDPCALVRLAVAYNEHTTTPSLNRLAQDPYSDVREGAGMRLPILPSVDFSLIDSILMSNCACAEMGDEEECEEFFESHRLDLPMIPQHLSEKILKMGSWHWATQPFPTRWDDYSLVETVAYLKGRVPDQFSVNHAGHGMNSYSLNLRLVCGDLGMIVQMPMGGVYMDSKQSESDWEEICGRTSFILMVAGDICDEIRERKYLVISSSFRLEKPIELWKNSESGWSLLNEVNNWDILRDYMVAEYGDPYP